MGSKERKVKEKAERKELILNSATNLIRSSGVQALTMRKLADLIEYSPCVVYETFPNKDSLIIELFSTVCKELLNVMQSVPSADNPEVYFKQLILSDVEFMMQEPHRVELFIIVSSEASPEDFPSQMQDVIELIRKGLKGLGYSKLSTKREIEDAQEVLRTFLAGVLRLVISQRSTKGRSRCKRILENGLNMLLEGWKSKKK